MTPWSNETLQNIILMIRVCNKVALKYNKYMINDILYYSSMLMRLFFGSPSGHAADAVILHLIIFIPCSTTRGGSREPGVCNLLNMQGSGGPGSYS